MNDKLQWNAVIRLAILAGLAQVVTGVSMYLSGIYFVPSSTLISISVLTVCIVFETRWYREQYQGGSITYRRAFIVGLCISVGTGLVYAIYNLISVSYFYPNFLEEMVSAGVQRRSEGLTPDGVQALANAFRAQVTLGRIALTNLIALSATGSVLSLIISVFIKRSEEQAEQSPVGASGNESTT